MTRPRRFRVVWEPEPDPRPRRRPARKNWVVQYQLDRRHTWTDVARFDSYQKAAAYQREAVDRDRTLLEATS